MVFKVAASGVVVLRVVAAVMVLLGTVGLVSSVFLFGQVHGELSKIDATVQNVAKTVTSASDSVGAASGALDQGITSAVSFLNTTARGIGDTGVVLRNAKTTVENASMQVPVVIGSTASTIEAAAKSMLTARGDLNQVEEQFGSMHKNLDLPGKQAQVEDQKKVLSGQSIVLTGHDLIASATWLAPRLGVAESVLVDEGDRLVRAQKALALSAESIQVTGDDLVQLSSLAESLLVLDASQLRSEGEAATEKGTVWTVLPLTRMQEIADNMNQVDGLVSRARATLTNSGKEIQALSANLNDTANSLRATVDDVTVVTGHAGQLLEVAGKQMATVDTSLQDVSKQVGSFKGVAEKQLVQVNATLRGTAEAMGQISITSLGGSLITGLRTYMIITNLLFILSGLGLFSITLRTFQPAAIAASEAA